MADSAFPALPGLDTGPVSRHTPYGELPTVEAQKTNEQAFPSKKDASKPPDFVQVHTESGLYELHYGEFDADHARDLAAEVVARVPDEEDLAQRQAVIAEIIPRLRSTPEVEPRVITTAQDSAARHVPTQREVHGTAATLRFGTKTPATPATPAPQVQAPQQSPHMPDNGQSLWDTLERTKKEARTVTQPQTTVDLPGVSVLFQPHNGMRCEAYYHLVEKKDDLFILLFDRRLKGYPVIFPPPDIPCAFVITGRGSASMYVVKQSQGMRFTVEYGGVLFELCVLNILEEQASEV